VRATSAIDGFEVHGSPLEGDSLSDAWRRCESLDETRHLERAARTSREKLLEHLPTEYARALSPERTTEVFESLPCFENPVELVVAGRVHRTKLCATTLRTRARGTLLLGTDDRTQLALDRRYVGSAHLVEMPHRSGSRRALEFVDGDGRFAARIQRPSTLAPTRILSWRASLDGGCRC